MGKVLTNSLVFSLLIILILPTLSQNDLNNSNDILYTEVIDGEGDAWLNLELLSWQGNTSTTWDSDGTDIDVQFQVCIDLDGESDGVSPLCTWTEVWNNTLTLTNAWDTTFDLIEDNSSLNITIECWDNDDFADEWGNGPDACDMNPNDGEWRLYYEVNWSNITTETFSGDGSIGNDTQWGNAESTWKVTVSYYGDEDNDGVFDNADECEGSTQPNNVDQYGCAWADFDFDSDGITNGLDVCSTVPYDCGHILNKFILGQRRTLLDAFGRTNQLQGIAQPNPHQFYAKELCGDVHARIDISEMTYTCTRDGGYSGGTVRFDSNYDETIHIYSHEISTGNWATNYYQLETPWGNYNPGAYCCTSADLGVIVRPQISNLVLSEDGKFVVWAEEHYPEEGSFSEIWMWKNGSNPTKIHNLTGERGSSDWTSWVGTGNLILSPDGRYLLVGHRNDARQGKSIIFDIESMEKIAEHQCVSVAIAYNSNTLACQTDQQIEFFSVETNSSIFEFSIPYTVANIRYSPSDNHLLIQESTTTKNGFQVVNLQTGNFIDFLPPEKEGFNEPQVQYATFIDSDFTIVAFVSYHAEHASQNSGSSEHRHEIITYGLDRDGDGVIWFHDNCKDTQSLTEVNSVGCSQDQRDSDLDGVSDATDQCPNTPVGAPADDIGCTMTQIDSDADGISDASDECPNTPNDESIGLTGCSSSQRDLDGDGIYDSQDNCPNTPSGTTVDSTGCAPDDVIDLDSDGDGVRDSVDTCPDSKAGIIVNSTGCETSGDVQTSEEKAQSEDPSSLEICGGLIIFVIFVYGGVKGWYDEDDDSSSDLTPNISTPEPEPNLELQNVIAELERQRQHSEQEMNRIRQQQITQQSSAAEIAAMQQEMLMLQQKVADSNQAKLQLQDEIEQVKSQKDNIIKMQDSVVGGDVVTSGGQKIETQTNVIGTDPEAIARIIFEAQERATLAERQRLKEERGE